MPSIKDVAEKAGVAISTVSNVINNNKSVSDKLRKKVNDSIIDLNYVVNPVARCLKSKKSMNIGVVINDIGKIFFPPVLKGIQDEARKNEYTISFFETSNNILKEKDIVRMMINCVVDGIIIHSLADMGDVEYFNELAQLESNRKRIPVVSIERNLCAYGIDSVGVDNYVSAGIIVDHLISQGCKNIIHINGPVSSCLATDRFNAYKDSLTKGNLKICNELIYQGDFSPVSGYNAIKEAMLSDTTFDGIFASNDQMAIGAIKAIRESGRKIPDDVKIAGFDNSFIASIITPTLTTIDVPKYNMGVVSVQMLIKNISLFKEKKDFYELPTNIVIRNSTSEDGIKDWDLYGW